MQCDHSLVQRSARETEAAGMSIHGHLTITIPKLLRDPPDVDHLLFQNFDTSLAGEQIHQCKIIWNIQESMFLLIVTRKGNELTILVIIISKPFIRERIYIKRDRNFLAEPDEIVELFDGVIHDTTHRTRPCLLYTSPSPRDVEESRMPSSA